MRNRVRKSEWTILQEKPSTLNFYSKMSPFAEFREVADLGHYDALPDDWTLLVSDVINSTGAIERGEYKRVNMVGAASIKAVLNVSGDVQLPFVFGGDGGLIAVPPELLEETSTQLKRLQAASTGLFGLALRGAAIPVSALRSSGADTLVRKFKLSEGNHLAMFGGSGPKTADEWLKADPLSRGYALVPDEDEELPDLNGLSCRWEPIKARNGTMLTVILQPSANEAGSELEAISNAISDILGGSLSDFGPVHKETMKFRFPPRGLKLEIAAGVRFSNRILRTIWAYFTASMQYLCERFDLSIGGYDGATYRDEVMSNTDFRKYDGALRMVLDVSVKQVVEIETILEREHAFGRLVYGTWQADEALMTCLMFSLTSSQHVHLVDGADGGYAMAAKDLKRRVSIADNTKEMKSNFGK